MFKVVWRPRAKEELKQAWQASDAAVRERIKACIVAIDKMLSLAPHDVGESRIDLMDRILFEPPLSVSYRILEPEEAKVAVYQAKLIQRRKG